MSELTIDRRQAVRAAAGLAAGGLLVTGAGVTSASANGSSSDLVGSWLVTHKDEDGEEGLSVASFIGGGVLISNDVRPAGGVGTGSWEDKGGGKFKGTFWIGNPADNTSVRVEVWGKVEDGKISGHFEVTVYDSAGKEIHSVKGTFTGKRLEA